MSEKTSPGLSEGLESLEKSEVEVEGPTGPPDRLDKLHNVITSQTNAIMLLTGKLAEMTKKVESLEAHQDQADATIIEVAKKIGGGGGGSNLLAQVLPFLQSRGPGPLEKIANQMFIRNIAFTSLTTERLAKKQFGEEYARMVKDMEAELTGAKTVDAEVVVPS